MPKPKPEDDLLRIVYTCFNLATEEEYSKPDCLLATSMNSFVHTERSPTVLPEEAPQLHPHISVQCFNLPFYASDSLVTLSHNDKAVRK